MSQVKLSLPGTFDLVQPAQKLDPLPSISVGVSVCLSGWGDYLGRDCIGGYHKGGGLQRRGLQGQGTTEAGTSEAQTGQAVTL